MTEQKQEVFEEFKKEITNQIVYFEREVSNLKKHSRSCETSLINSLKSLDLKRKQVNDLKKFSRDINKTLKEQVEEIKQLPFVKDVRITTRSISVDVGKVEITYRDKNIYIGDFTIAITPQGIEVKNRNPIIVNGVLYEHPHIDGHSICYGGERQVKIQQQFAKFQLKQLVYMVYLFLKTYTERDNYNSITYWTQEAKRKERKQKVIIGMEEQKLIVGEN
jgi:hypothetical protein